MHAGMSSENSTYATWMAQNNNMNLEIMGIVIGIVVGVAVFLFAGWYFYTKCAPKVGLWIARLTGQIHPAADPAGVEMHNIGAAAI